MILQLAIAGGVQIKLPPASFGPVLFFFPNATATTTLTFQRGDTTAAGTIFSAGSTPSNMSSTQNSMLKGVNINAAGIFFS
jgi:hypothetical protein